MASTSTIPAPSSSASVVGPTATPTSTPAGSPDIRTQLLHSATLVFHVSLFIYALIALVFVLRIPHLIGLFGTSAEWYNGHLFRFVGGGSISQMRRSASKTRRRRERQRELMAGEMKRNDSTRTVVGDGGLPGKEKDVTDTGVDFSLAHYYNNGLEANPDPSYPSRHNAPRARFQQHRQYAHRTHERGFIEPRFPIRVPAVPAFMRPLLVLSRTRGIVPGYSLGQVVVLLVYFCILVYVSMYKSNPFTDATRPAWVAVSQIPLVLVLAGKGGNILGGLLGYGYERINYIHRFVGKMVVLGSNLHVIFYVYRWTAAGTFTQLIAQPKNAWGMALLVAINVLYVFSTPFWRLKAYNVFIWSHTISVLVVIPAIYMHQHSLWVYTVASASVYMLDRVLRLAKTRVTTAVLISQRNSNDTVLLEVQGINAGWRAGQHVRVRVLEGRNSGMGVLGWSEIHPFTIASAGSIGGDEGAAAAAGTPGMRLVVKRAGDWTGKLVKLGTSRRDRIRKQQQRVKNGGLAGDGGFAPEYPDASEDMDPGSGSTMGVKIRVWLEGPYGGCGRMVFASFSAALIVCGGSGISFGLSMLQDLTTKDAVGESRLKYIELVWVVTDSSAVDGILPTILDLVEQYDSADPGVGGYVAQVKVGIWFTRALTARLGVIEGEAGEWWSDEVGGDDAYRPIAVHPNVILSPGRPRVGRSLEMAMGRAVSLEHSYGGEEEGRGVMGVAVGVCGPRELAEEVVGVVGRVSAVRRDQVGGIEVHEETFGM